MKERDDKILRHVGRYGISLRVVIEELFFDGGSCDFVINRLTSEPDRRLRTVPIGRTKLRYYHLSISEARARELPDHRGRPRKGEALRVAIQVLWFCCMSGKKRTRIERNKLAKELGRGKGFGRPHVAELDENGQQGIVYRVYCPGPTAREDYLLKALQADYNEVTENTKLTEWIREGSFAFAVLVETQKRKEKLERLIEKQDLTEIKVLVEVIPGLMTLSEAVQKVSLGRSREGDSNVSQS